MPGSVPPSSEFFLAKCRDTGTGNLQIRVLKFTAGHWSLKYFTASFCRVQQNSTASTMCNNFQQISTDESKISAVPGQRNPVEEPKGNASRECCLEALCACVLYRSPRDAFWTFCIPVGCVRILLEIPPNASRIGFRRLILLRASCRWPNVQSDSQIKSLSDWMDKQNNAASLHGPRSFVCRGAGTFRPAR